MALAAVRLARPCLVLHMMLRNRGRFCCVLRHCGLLSNAMAVVLLAAFFALGPAPPAQALPSFARQTGQPCGTCHTDFAGLTPFGRRFKIGGYTYGGGPHPAHPIPEFPGYQQQDNTT